MIQAVLFDLDGVLIRTDELHYRSWQELAEAEGIPFDRTVNHRLRGVGRLDSLAIVLERARRRYDPSERLALADRKNATYRGLLEAMTPDDVLPGVVDLLAQLAERPVKRAVASSSKNAALALERTELADWFDAVIDGNDVQHSKPHPQVFLLAAQRLQVAPKRCLVIEDAASGVQAARRAGMAVVGIGSARELPGADRVVGSLTEVTVDELLALAAT
ncbi:MAG: beta-phosphoglucomutase [Planctomycetes bacterium]|nr:beta-phosphoglucomutase [Planctomycetota bacterium]